MKYLSNLDRLKLKDSVVLLRSGFNVPVVEGVVADDFRIIKSLDTINFLANTSKQLIIISHIGREENETLRPVFDVLSRYVDDAVFVNDVTDIKSVKAKIILVENLRRDDRETSVNMSSRDEFAEFILENTGADIFIQDAFSVCHRNNSSITSIPKYIDSFAGFLIEDEVRHLSKVLKPEFDNSVFILGGSKLKTKEPLLKKFIGVYQKIFVTGVIANEFFKAGGLDVGDSKIDDGIVDPMVLSSKKIILPNDVIVKKGNDIRMCKPYDVHKDEMIVDALPPKALDDLFSHNDTFVVWNGSVGFYEGGFKLGTKQLLGIFSENIANLYLVAGGGDTISTIPREYRNMFMHISTGGGSMLKFLEDETLIGLDALE